MIGQPELPDDPRFVDGITRRANGAALNHYIDAWLATRTRAEAVKALRDGGVPASLVNDVADLFDCPHVAAREMLMTLDDPVWGPIQVAGNPIKMSDVPEPEATLPPRLGQHTGAVLGAWLQMSDDEVDALRSQQVI